MIVKIVENSQLNSCSLNVEKKNVTTFFEVNERRFLIKWLKICNNIELMTNSESWTYVKCVTKLRLNTLRMSEKLTPDDNVIDNTVCLHGPWG